MVNTIILKINTINSLLGNFWYYSSYKCLYFKLHINNSPSVIPRIRTNPSTNFKMFYYLGSLEHVSLLPFFPIIQFLVCWPLPLIFIQNFKWIYPVILIFSFYCKEGINQAIFLLEETLCFYPTIGVFNYSVVKFCSHKPSGYRYKIKYSVSC